MNRTKKIYQLLMVTLPLLSLALTFLIIQPASIIGYVLCALIGFTVYFFLWLIVGKIIPDYVKNLRKNK
ncbi:hypothetical protein ACFSPU_08795 [Haoranjiania flava]|uniref:Uncharacterized protein n=1 Tax=Haoranjiania flava TaxID=1856322 RepID=A0AAE3IQ02_9BACT|nr:hypothetical protein [Haoranjiania flava]MCU7694943.1 hypothetical protein [Haoranjiania flava]